MANSLNMRCPSCGDADYIDIAAILWVRVTDDGTNPDESDSPGGHEFDPESPAHCCACGHAGHVADFEKQEDGPTVENITPVTIDTLAGFDGFEVQGCTDDGTATTPCDDAEAQFWTVYGHYDPAKPHGLVGVEALFDLDSRQDAESLAMLFEEVRLRHHAGPSI